MLLFNVIAAYAGVYVFLRWNDGQWMLSRSTVTPQSDEVARQVITPEFSELARKLMAKGDVPGLSVGVVRWSESSASNADVEFGSWGIMSEQGANVTADTLFNIGSCSKAVLAVTMGILMEDFKYGRNNTALPPGLTELSWNSRINDLLPADEWGLANEWATKEATIGDILSHVSGLPRHDFAWDYTDSTVDVVKRLRYLKTTHGLRQEWDYNNQMYILGAHIITRYAGVSYTQYAKERVFHVLGMSATTFDPSVAERSGDLSHAWSYTGRRIPLWFGSDASKMLAGPGGVISNARDMTKWIAALIPGVTNILPQDNVLPPQVLTDVTQARAIVFGRSAVPGLSMIAYGMGWMRLTYLGHEVYAGTYANIGYGNITFCAPSTSSAYCDRVRAAFALTHNDTLNSSPALLAEWPRLLASHIRLVPHEPDADESSIFWLTTHYMFPEGYGKDQSPFDYELFPPGFGLYAQCATGEGFEDEGCGVFLTLEGYDGRKEGVPLREQADLWFEKVA
ncbi:hypothetical protein TRAPUB_3616 [Trametes pubescens]|uniref:Beta-lactamase-related domain-containing protein n=1 Tax=Trametes pubescens TaxID=154538 RepID=A0A1M2VDF5_TRAPU|nr:hypothetical protein TRAPUB_3616 [Trametes pubescens]